LNPRPEIHQRSNFSTLINAIESRLPGVSDTSDLPFNDQSASDQYDLMAVSDLLVNAFSDDALTAMVFEKYRSFYDELGSGMGKREKVRRLVEWCNNNLKIDSLIREVHSRNPAQYKRWKIKHEGTPASGSIP
jgi:hypothetical protein